MIYKIFVSNSRLERRSVGFLSIHAQHGRLAAKGGSASSSVHDIGTGGSWHRAPWRRRSRHKVMLHSDLILRQLFSHLGFVNPFRVLAKNCHFKLDSVEFALASLIGRISDSSNFLLMDDRSCCMMSKVATATSTTRFSITLKWDWPSIGRCDIQFIVMGRIYLHPD